MLNPLVLDTPDPRFREPLEKAVGWDPDGMEPLQPVVSSTRSRRYFELRTSILNIACALGKQVMTRPSRGAIVQSPFAPR